MQVDTTAADRNALSGYLADRREAVVNYIKGFGLTSLVGEPHVRDFLLSYPSRGGKSLRPALIALAAGASSGKEMEDITIPLQAAVELSHNWTIIHDDIIDEDDLRRGKPSLHREIEAAARKADIVKDVENLIDCFNRRKLQISGIRIACVPRLLPWLHANPSIFCFSH